MNIIAQGDKGLQPLEGDLTNKVLVLLHTKLNRRHQIPRFQLFKALGGFGCKERSLGRAVFGVHIADNEDARWNRSDFIGIAQDSLIKEAMEDTTPVKGIDLNARVYMVFTKDGTFSQGDTVDQAMTRLRRITKSAVSVAYHAHPESTINDFGYMSYPSGAEPVEVKIKRQGAIWIDGN